MPVEYLAKKISITCLARLAWSLCLLASTTLSGCGSPVYNEHITGSYYLLATDSITRLHVCRDVGNGGCLGRVPHTVYSVGFDSVYLVAKVNSGTPEEPQIYYYYLNMADDDGFKNAGEVTVGPLTRQQYLKAKLLFGLPAFSLTAGEVAPAEAQDKL